MRGPSFIAQGNHISQKANILHTSISSIPGNQNSCLFCKDFPLLFLQDQSLKSPITTQGPFKVLENLIKSSRSSFLKNSPTFSIDSREVDLSIGNFLIYFLDCKNYEHQSHWTKYPKFCYLQQSNSVTAIHAKLIDLLVQIFCLHIEFLQTN